MEKEHQRDFLKLKKSIKARINFLNSLNYTDEIKENRKQELEIALKLVNNIVDDRINPIESVTTINGETTYKIGDYFTIPGDELTKYKIVLFPDALTLRGESDNSAIGKPTVCEVYLEFARKVEKSKTKKIKQIKEPKKVKIKEGDYFRIRTNNTIYKAIEVTKKKVIGTNELTFKNAPKRIKTKKSEIILKTKKEYKQQHKAERKHKDENTKN